MSSISDLPPELLSLILVETQAEARVYNTPTHEKRFPFAPDAIHWLRLTNRTFNSIILCAPQIWSFIAVTDNAPTYKRHRVRFLQWERHITRHIERSGPCPLDVTFTNAQDEALQVLYALLSPYMGRLRSLRFLVGLTPLANLRSSYRLLQPFFMDHALPLLETLTVLSWNISPYGAHNSLAVGNLPNLKHLTVTGGQKYKIRFSSPNPPKLRSLELKECIMDQASFVEFIGTSEETLEFLDVNFHGGGVFLVKGPASWVPLLALRTLRVNMMYRWSLLTENFYAPNLRSLTLSWPPRHAPHDNTHKNPKPLEPMLHLQNLEWQSMAADTPDARESFEAILTACPNVQRLGIVEKLVRDPDTGALPSFGPLSEELKVLATEEQGRVKFCAGLKVLKVSCPSSELLDKVKGLRGGALEAIETGYRATY
ncbi:hypothetical protein FRB99_000130 [Tulasnella sp. 403]|nr:hypothetical protein FRB99_000130 [Tulasnella sp. 403]